MLVRGWKLEGNFLKAEKRKSRQEDSFARIEHESIVRVVDFSEMVVRIEVAVDRAGGRNDNCRF
jgi:hypothetical protein